MSKTIDKKSIERMLDDNENVLIINVLPEEYYAKRNIPTSINIPLKDNDSFIQEVEESVLNKDQKIIVYCASSDCDLSEKAQEKLEDAGFTQVLDYKEGTDGWFGDEASESKAA